MALASTEGGAKAPPCGRGLGNPNWLSPESDAASRRTGAVSQILPATRWLARGGSPASLVSSASTLRSSVVSLSCKRR